MTELAERLRDARAQLDGRDPSFYPTLRDAWRACRCDELAALLERAGRITSWPDTAKTPKAWQAAWIATARQGDPLVLGGLLASLAERAEPAKAAVVGACLDELPDLADDPQVVATLIGMLAIHTASSAWIKVHTRAFKLLDAAGDPRAIDRVTAACTRTQAELDVSKAMAASVARAERTRRVLLARFPDGVPPLPAELAPILAELADAIARSEPIAAKPRPVAESTSLLDAVLADPFDDARRLVCADALQAAGDPRGELIVAQLSDSPEAARRAKAILGKHKSALLGPLARAVKVSTAVFERGFLARCEAGVTRKVEVDAIFDRPEWATVTHMTCSSYAKLAPAMRSLVEVIRVPDSGLACLATATFPRLEVLGLATPLNASDGLKGATPSSAGLRALAGTTGLPKLRELRLELAPIEWRQTETRDGEMFERDAAAYAWLFAAPFGGQLETLHVLYNAASSLTSWLGLVRARPTLRRVTATGGYFTVAITATEAFVLPRRADIQIPDTARVELREALAGVTVTET
ncbi:MAG TPA: TIGR02996 domain-containing protein [Kofleriaceae bacterium]|jgi:uncharacterized protein (TIGR02996 family)